jgi:hypothetical protein
VSATGHTIPPQPRTRSQLRLTVGPADPVALARLPGTAVLYAGFAALRFVPNPQSGRFHTVKKMLVLALLGLGVAAVWRKVQADRAEIDLWTEATTAELN